MGSSYRAAEEAVEETVSALPPEPTAQHGDDVLTAHGISLTAEELAEEDRQRPDPNATIPAYLPTFQKDLPRVLDGFLCDLANAHRPFV